MGSSLNWLKKKEYPREPDYVTRPEFRTTGTQAMGDKWFGSVVPGQSPMRTTMPAPGVSPGPAATPKKKITARRRKSRGSKTITATPKTKKLGPTKLPMPFPKVTAQKAAPTATGGGGTGISGAWKGLSPDTKNILRVGGGALAGIALAKLFSDSDTEIETTYKGPVYNRYYYR